MSWTDTRCPVPRLWIRSAEVRRGGGVVRRMETQQHLMCLHFPIILIFNFCFFQNSYSLSCLSKDINKSTTFINIFTKLLVFESKHLFQI